ncbi:hypothetical protein F5X68DRAFT_228000 [Plectosphaerella plurivora]|uniref:Uncharacterized protein n=1 Tax=Plectosphaerella plurivora TaxID=936078 RepID=A0A9P9ADV0_9PEZI|nr:hypothetical protein F5X68DRAFT_228000 [Plectosphaerella plurivora]
MQFSSIVFALFATVALAAPSQIESRQNTMCNLCREECFFLKGPFEPCLDRCNKDLECTLTP